MTEKRFAVTAVILATLIMIAYSYISAYLYSETTEQWSYFALTNSLWFVIPFTMAWLPYVAVRSAAVAGSALTALGLFIFFAFVSNSMDDPKGGGAVWLIYIFWMAGAFITALFFAIACPDFFTRTAKRAFMFGGVFTFVAGFVTGFLVSRLS